MHGETMKKKKKIGIHSGWYYKRKSGLKHRAVQRSTRSCFNRNSTVFSKHPTG